MLASDVIYDFGANDGVNLEYYLRKGSVVAVEANPALCERIDRRFADEIRSGRLTVLNVALTNEENRHQVPFYAHRTNDLLSHLAPPTALDEGQYEKIEVTCRAPASVVSEYGPPAYVKVDLEDYDAAVLRNLFDAGIFPPEISAEAGTVEVFALMVANGYTSFCLVDGASVVRRGFPEHSAGPFGEDIGGRWEDPDTFLTTLASQGLGWKDIHASTMIPAAPRPSGTRAAARMAAALSRRGLAKFRIGT